METFPALLVLCYWWIPPPLPPHSPHTHTHTRTYTHTQKGQWNGASMFSLICAWTSVWVNNRYAGDLRCYSTHYKWRHCNAINNCDGNGMLGFQRHSRFWGNPIAVNEMGTCVAASVTLCLMFKNDIASKDFYSGNLKHGLSNTNHVTSMEWIRNILVKFNISM